MAQGERHQCRSPFFMWRVLYNCRMPHCHSAIFSRLHTLGARLLCIAVVSLPPLRGSRQTPRATPLPITSHRFFLHRVPSLHVSVVNGQSLPLQGIHSDERTGTSYRHKPTPDIALVRCGICCFGTDTARFVVSCCRLHSGPFWWTPPLARPAAATGTPCSATGEFRCRIAASIRCDGAGDRCQPRLVPY